MEIISMLDVEYIVKNLIQYTKKCILLLLNTSNTYEYLKLQIYIWKQIFQLTIKIEVLNYFKSNNTYLKNEKYFNKNMLQLKLKRKF